MFVHHPPIYRRFTHISTDSIKYLQTSLVGAAGFFFTIFSFDRKKVGGQNYIPRGRRIVVHTFLLFLASSGNCGVKRNFISATTLFSLNNTGVKPYF